MIKPTAKARNKLGMTQEELAQKCGTNKFYISRIKNNSSDIRLSTLMRKIQKGLGGHLKMILDINNHKLQQKLTSNN